MLNDIFTMELFEITKDWKYPPVPSTEYLLNYNRCVMEYPAIVLRMRVFCMN